MSKKTKDQIMNSKLVKKLLLLFEITVINPLLTITGFSMYLGDEKYSTDWLNTRKKIKGFIKLIKLHNNSSISDTPFRCWRDNEVKEGVNLKRLCDYCGEHYYTLIYTEKKYFFAKNAL
ncbi:MAG: hypothetical protein IKP71_11565 [Candidatus Riflebacteria bacterium]|nr:hypothetical protein [Candidatus Riflebacteria bacterium]